MSLIADILLIVGALGATFYCMVLSRRLKRFNDLESGVGGAIAVLSAQVDDMTKSLISAQSAAKDSTGSLRELTTRADDTAHRLELLVASLHELPDPEDSAREASATLETQEEMDASVPKLAFARGSTDREDEANPTDVPLTFRRHG